nr:telomere-associated protein RIF1-like [Leptinotarsa decemlineata]
MDLTNRLLRVVEFAFRSPSVQQRLRGYDCWKELIDNASLDVNHICSSKQIKLLVTPLRAKFSKQEVVISKRFDVFTYLLEKLKHKAVLCLKDFLEFCFGPVGDNKDESRTGQGKSVLEVRVKSTKVLIEIIGVQSDEKPYLDDLLGVIFTALVSFDKDSKHQFHECIQSILQELITIFFKIGNIPTATAENFKKIVSHMFSQIMLKEEKIKMMETIMKCFSSVESRDECASNVAKIWLCLVSELITELTPEKIEEFVKFREYFLWPAHNLHFLDDKTKKQIILNWMKLYKKLSAEAEDKKLLTMKHLDTIFKNNPLLASDIICLLNVMSQVEMTSSREFVIKLMEVTTSILLLPNLQSEDEQKITSLIIQYLQPSLECYKSVDDERVIKVICTNIEHILCIHEGFKLLEPLANFIRNCSKDIRSKFSKHLETLLIDLYTKENDTKSYNAKELSKVLGVFSENDPKEDKKTFVIPSGRSARIANLAKSSPKTPSKCQKIGATASPTSLRLFGKDPETMSPLRARGSQLNNATPKRNKKISSNTQIKAKSTPSINEEDSSDFVKIETEVKFQPSKLNEHQKEVMRKRREDIPALYQDLSQSLSQDIFSSKSNSKEALENKDKKETSNDNPKVIVEKVNSFIYSFPTDEGLESKSIQMSESDADIMEEKLIITRGSENETRAVEKTPKMNSESDLFSEDIKNLPFEKVMSDEVISGSLEENMAKLPNDTKMAFKDFNKDLPPLSGDDLFSQISKGHEQDEKVKTEGTISADLFSEAGSSHAPKDDRKDTKLDVFILEHEEKSNGKKRKKVEAELGRLKMDIVGAEQFLETKRRTRTKEKPTKFEETLSNGKKAKKSPPEENVTGGRKKKGSPTEKNVNDAEKINTSLPGKGRRSISLEKSEKPIEKNRRKTIGDMHNKDSEKYASLPLETSSLALSVPKKSTDNAKPLEDKSSKQIVSLPNTPQPKSKERKTPISKKKHQTVQDIKPSQIGHTLNKIEQDTPVGNNRKSVKLQKGSAPKDEINSTPDPKKSPTAKKKPLKPEEDFEMVHVPEMDANKGERRQKDVDELQNNEGYNHEETPFEVEEKQSASNEKEADFVKCTVNLQEGATSIAEKEHHGHNTEKNSPQIAEQPVELSKQLMIEDVEMPTAVDVEIQDPISKEKETEMHEKELISKQLKVDEIERGEQKEPVILRSSLKLPNDYPIESPGATFTIEPKILNVLVKPESPTKIRVLNSGEENLNEAEFETHKNKSETSAVDEETPDIFFERRGEKRKHSTDDDDDIIESSQESFAEVTSLNSSKKRQLKALIENTSNSEENTMIQQKTVTPADFISDIKKSKTNCIEIIEETEVYQEALPNYNKKDDGENETEDICSKKLPKEGLIEDMEEIPEKIDNLKGCTDKKIDDPNSLSCLIPIEETVPSREIPSKSNESIEHTDHVELDTSKGINTTQDSTLTQDSLQIEENVDQQVSTQDTMTQPTFTQDTPTQQDMSEDSAFPTLYFDLPKKPNLTESEQMMCQMDTMSICGVKDNELLVKNQTEDHHSMKEIELRDKTVTGSNEIKNISLENTSDAPVTCNTSSSSDNSSSPNRSSSLPSSPITVDTPTRTSKLLDDTMDISPIKSNSSPETNNSIEIPVPSRLFFQDDFQELGERKKLIKSASETDDDTVPWKNDDVNGGNLLIVKIIQVGLGFCLYLISKVQVYQ